MTISEEYMRQQQYRLQFNDVIDSLEVWRMPSSNCNSSGGTTSTPLPVVNKIKTNSVSPDQGYTNPEPDTCGTPTDEKQNSRPSPEVVAKTPVSKYAVSYNMKHRNRGKCVVFNHENFNTGHVTRKGSTADVQRIEQTFKKLGFFVEICKDYKYNSICTKIEELSKEDHSDNDCICIFVLTHGFIDDIVCAKDVLYKLDNIWSAFTANKCTTLAGKPKLFFIQACRGEKTDAGITMQESGTIETDSSTTSYRIPSLADFLVAHSTVHGFVSRRDTEKGTWFVQSLCDIIDEHATRMDLLHTMTLVSMKVSTDYTSNDEINPLRHELKQVPSVTSMLIRLLYFTPKND